MGEDSEIQTVLFFERLLCRNTAHGHRKCGKQREYISDYHN